MQKYAYAMGLFFLCLILLLCSASLANAGPTFWSGYPSAEMLCIEENSPIEVLSEELTFDLHAGEMNGYTLSGQVTAAYEMNNPLEENASVMMAFPLIENFQSFDMEKIRITAGGLPVSYQLYIGEPVGNDVDLADYGFADVLAGINKQETAWNNFAKDTPATLLHMNIEKRTQEDVNVRFTFDNSSGGAHFLASGIHAMGQYEDGRVELEAWTGNDNQVDVLIIGEVPAYVVSGYTDDYQKAEDGSYSYEVETTPVVMGEYLLQAAKRMVRQDMPEADVIAMDAHMEGQLFGLFASCLDRKYQDGNSVATLEDIASISFSEKRMMVLLYEVEFPAGGTLPVSVCYPVTGSMDRSETSSPIYKFTYLFDPASHWRSFQDLEIVIVTPEQTPNIIESSIPFSQDGERRFVAHLQELPQEPLVFSLFGKEDVSLIERASATLWNQFYFFTPILIGIVILALVLALVVIFKRRKKRKAGE